MPLIDGHIDRVEGGLVLGWARGSDPNVPCHVRVMLNGEVVAEALANIFRPDLLYAGIGHGHYAFAARLRIPLASGTYPLSLHSPEHGPADSGKVVLVTVPAPETIPQITVEALISRGDQWRIRDVLARLDCLQLADNLAAMGAERFVDVCYRFVLCRWPHPDEAERHANALIDGALTADQLLIDLVRLPEQRTIGTAMPAPYDPLFPFRLS